MSNKGKMVQYIEVVCGAVLMAAAYKSIYDSAGMVTGGFSGIGVIVKRLTEGWIKGGVPLWLTNILLNTPLYIFAYNIEGKEFVKRTLLGTILLTIALGVLPSAAITEADYILASVYGGVLCGAGIGLVLRSGFTTGGTDMLAVVLHRWLPQYSVAQIMQVLDALIVISGIAVFGLDVSLYAIIAIYVTLLVTDGVAEGIKHARAAIIISDKNEEIAKELMEKVQRGVTIFTAKGAFSKEEKGVLLCIVSKKQVPQLRQLVLAIDGKSFLIVGDVREVLGEGFVQKLQ